MLVGLLSAPSRINEVKVLMKRLRGFGIDSAGLTIGDNWSGAVPSDWKRLVESTTHMVLFPVQSSLPEWVLFLLGAAAGRNIPIALVGEVTVPSVYSHATIVSPDLIEDHLLSERSSWDRSHRVEMALFRLHGKEADPDAFYDAAREGDIERVQDFLTVGMSSDTRSTIGVPVIVGAVRSGSVEVVQFLVNEGADVNATCGDNGESPLCEASSRGLATIVGVLLAAGAGPNQQTASGQTALMLAASQGHGDIVLHLLSAGADPEIRDSLGMTATDYARLFSHDSLESLSSSVPLQT
jgi:hypothetical protein